VKGVSTIHLVQLLTTPVFQLYYALFSFQHYLHSTFPAGVRQVPISGPAEVDKLITLKAIIMKFRIR